MKNEGEKVDTENNVLKSDVSLHDKEINLNQKYFPKTFVRYKECVMIRSCMGSGKTCNVIKPTISRENEHSTIISVGCRRSLNNQYV